VAGNVTILYRIVEHDPPTWEDMLSYHDLGIPLRVITPEALRRSRGISLYNTLLQARKLGAGPPWHGSGFIAELRIPDNAPLTIERTGRQRGHYTLWGSPDDILGYITRVVPIRSGEESG
jgi:hypothetical protein